MRKIVFILLYFAFSNLFAQSDASPLLALAASLNVHNLNEARIQMLADKRLADEEFVSLHDIPVFTMSLRKPKKLESLRDSVINYLVPQYEKKRKKTQLPLIRCQYYLFGDDKWIGCSDNGIFYKNFNVNLPTEIIAQSLDSLDALAAVKLPIGSYPPELILIVTKDDLYALELSYEKSPVLKKWSDYFDENVDRLKGKFEFVVD